MYKKCPNCGGLITDRDEKCPLCQCDLNGGGQQNYYRQPRYNNQPNGGGYGYNQGGIRGDERYLQNDMFAPDPFGKSRGVAALLAIFLGGFGIHYFYLGKTTGGVVFLIVALITCCSLPAIVALIQGILMLCMNNQEFTRKYVSTPSSFPIF